PGSSGAGGFGGGGGGAPAAAAAGGFGAGKGGSGGGGGGGLGAGGDIFVQAGGLLTIAGGSLTGGLVAAGGAGGSGAGNGAALGSSLFLQVASGETDTVGSLIKDGTGQPGQVFVMGATNGSGGLGNSGGTLVLSGPSTYTGGTTVEGGAAVSISADNNLGASSSPVTLDNLTALVFTKTFSLTHNITVSGDPTFDVAPGMTVTQTGTISDGSTPGDVVLTGGGTLKLDQQNSFTGGTTIDNGTLDFAHAGAAGTGPIDFDSSTNPKTLLIDLGEAPANNGAFGNEIGNFDNTIDVIELRGVGFQEGATASDDGSHLVFTDGNYTVTFDLTNSTAQPTEYAYTDGAGDTFVTNNPNYTPPPPACYCAGTMILTEHGEVAVEDLRIGDVLIARSGDARPVRWIGTRAYDGRFIADNRHVLPVCVTAGALGDGVPRRDLWVSPAHSLYVEGVLVPAAYLINGATIVQADSVKAVEYFHIELETHDIVFADGAPAETYIDCDNRGIFANAAEYAALYPDDERSTWSFCAPRLEEGSDALDRIHGALLRRAASLGHGFERDPDLHLRVGRAVVRPQMISPCLYRFEIPAGSTAVRLASRSRAPAELDAASRDRRRLGVPVERFVLHDSELTIEAGHGHPALRDGFHDDEASHRWTDGAGHLPDAWLHAFPHGATLDLHLVPTQLGYRPSASALQAAG
ncbi:MAG: Hint domain-containing protein, partial [Alphaproteobacteria bacterium]|nr:Hint domain-containing protein [Alphaproteobacteria bacterium]